MNTNVSSQPWVEGGDRSHRDAANAASEATARALLVDVNESRALLPTKAVKDGQTPSDYLEMTSLFGNNLDRKIERVQTEAKRYLQTQDPKIFEVNSGRFAGMQVPESLRCAIFQSNIAVLGGLIGRHEVTVRAIEFGNLIQRKGFEQERFVPGRQYPDGSYIVGQGGRGANEANHVALIVDGKILHTRAGRIEHEPISSKFRPGSYQQMRVYIPPGSRRAA